MPLVPTSNALKSVCAPSRPGAANPCPTVAAPKPNAKFHNSRRRGDGRVVHAWAAAADNGRRAVREHKGF